MGRRLCASAPRTTLRAVWKPSDRRRETDRGEDDEQRLDLTPHGPHLLSSLGGSVHTELVWTFVVKSGRIGEDAGQVAPQRNPPAESIGERLRRLRRERGLSQRQLSGPGVSYAYISRIEAGARQPSMKALRVLARKLGVSPDYLETGHLLGERDRRELALVDAELQLRLSDEPATAEDAFRRIYEEAVAAGDLYAATRAETALGLVAAQQGQHRQAAALLEQARASGLMTPMTHPDVYAALGRAYAAEGKQAQAAELWQRCLDEVRAEGA